MGGVCSTEMARIGLLTRLKLWWRKRRGVPVRIGRKARGPKGRIKEFTRCRFCGKPVWRVELEKRIGRIKRRGHVYIEEDGRIHRCPQMFAWARRRK